MTQVGLKLAILGLYAAALAAQETDYQVYAEPPRLLLDQRRLRLLKRERERESQRWQQFDALLAGKARMTEPGFALALWAQVAGRPSACRDAGEWSLKLADAHKDAELRQIALVYDWCQGQMGEATASLVARKLAATLAERPAGAAAVRSRVFAALAVADSEPEASAQLLKWAVEKWWRATTAPQLKAGATPWTRKEDLYGLVEFLFVVRDNLRLDLREDRPRVGLKSCRRCSCWVTIRSRGRRRENEYRIPAYTGNGDPDLREAALSRALELALVALTPTRGPHQFLQGWLMQDRFMMKSEFGIAYEFFWANPYQPGLAFSYMPDTFHARGAPAGARRLGGDAPWFSFARGQAQAFVKGRRLAVKTEGRMAPIELGPVRVFLGSAGQQFESGWSGPAEEGVEGGGRGGVHCGAGAGCALRRGGGPRRDV